MVKNTNYICLVSISCIVASDKMLKTRFKTKCVDVCTLVGRLNNSQVKNEIEEKNREMATR